jgi:hypothetical protein
VAVATQLLSGAVAHLLRRADAARREQDEERHALRSRRRERSSPGSLAPGPEADGNRPDVCAQNAERCESVVRLDGERDVRVVRRRAPVEAEDRDAARHQGLGEVLEEELTARAVAGGVEGDESAARPVFREAEGRGQPRDLELALEHLLVGQLIREERQGERAPGELRLSAERLDGGGHRG